MQKIITFFFILFSVLILSQNNSAQTKSNQQITAQMKNLNAGKNVLLEYDKSSDYSKLLLLSKEIADEQAKKNGLSSLTFGMMYGYNGREMTFTPDVFIITFWAKGNKTNFAQSHNWQAKD